MIENDPRMLRIEDACQGLYEDEAQWAWEWINDVSEQVLINCILRDRQA